MHTHHSPAPPASNNTVFIIYCIFYFRKKKHIWFNTHTLYVNNMNDNYLFITKFNFLNTPFCTIHLKCISLLVESLLARFCTILYIQYIHIISQYTRNAGHVLCLCTCIDIKYGGIYWSYWMIVESMQFLISLVHLFGPKAV